MTKFFKWAGLAAVAGILVSSFMPWIFIESRNLTLTGVDTRGTNFGKPAYVHFVLTAFFLVFHLIPKVFAKRINLVVVALNIAWAIRNFFILAVCQGGECPQRQTGLYLSVACCFIMFLAAFFPDVKLTQNNNL